MTRHRIRNEQINADTIAEGRLAKARERGEHSAELVKLVEADRRAHCSDHERAAAGDASSAPAKPRKSSRRR